MDAPFVRHTHAERELNMMVAIDVSRSMALGTTQHSKREAMTFITGSILFSALSDQINTGFLAFSDSVLLSTPPRRTRAAAWAVLEQAWALKPSSSKTLMLPMVRHLLTLKRMSIVFIVSDFVTDEDVLDGPELAQLAAQARRHRGRAGGSRRAELPAGARVPAHARSRVGPARRPSASAGSARERYAAAMPRAARGARARVLPRSHGARVRPDRPAVRCCRCCRSLRGEKRDPPLALHALVLAALVLRAAR